MVVAGAAVAWARSAGLATGFRTGVAVTGAAVMAGICAGGTAGAGVALTGVGSAAVPGVAVPDVVGSAALLVGVVLAGAEVVLWDCLLAFASLVLETLVALVALTAAFLVVTFSAGDRVGGACTALAAA